MSSLGHILLRRPKLNTLVRCGWEWQSQPYRLSEEAEGRIGREIYPRLERWKVGSGGMVPGGMVPGGMVPVDLSGETGRVESRVARRSRSWHILARPRGH